MTKSHIISGLQLGLRELIAMGVGGIFSVMGLAVGITGHATPIAFALGGLLALIAGYSYMRLALSFVSDGASFTYLEHAFFASKRAPVALQDGGLGIARARHTEESPAA